MSSDLRDKLVEAHGVLKEHMHDFVQMQFNVELNMTVQHQSTAGPAFIWEPSVDIILQTQDSVVTSPEHLNDHARQYLVGFFSTMSNTVMASGVLNDNTITPWKGMEIEGTIFNGQYGWEGSEFVDYQISTHPGKRTIVGVMSTRDNDLSIGHTLERAVALCDYVLVCTHKPTSDVVSKVLELKKEHGDKIVVRGILSKSAIETYLYPLCRTDTLLINLSDDSAWSDDAIREMIPILRNTDLENYRGINLKESVISVAEIKSHPPNAIGVVSDERITYMGNVVRWTAETAVGSLTKNTCVYRDGIDSFSGIKASSPAILRFPHMILSTTGNFVRPTQKEVDGRYRDAKLYEVDGSKFLPRKLVTRVLRGASRWSVFHT